MLKIRKFVKGIDEPLWVGLLNVAFREFKDWRAISTDEFISEEKDPSFDSEGRLIAEIDDKPVGAIHAHVDKSRRERKGFIQDFGVVPRFRDLGVEEKLVESAIDELRKKGMENVQAPRIRWPYHKKGGHIQFLERMGFRLIRRISLMDIDLEKVRSEIGKNIDVVFIALKENMKEDVKALSWLRNKCFEGRFNYRPTSVEETCHFLMNHPFSCLESYFAVLSKKKVGFIIIVIDEKFNAERKAKTGGIIAVGVLKPYRRRGIGAKLILHGLQMLKAKGMTRAMLDVDDFNQTKAKHLYEKVGFEVVEQYLTYEKKLSM